MVQLLVYDGLGDWKYINDSPDRADAVTAEDLQRAAREYLTRENRTVGIFLRQQTPPGPESPATQEPRR